MLPCIRWWQPEELRDGPSKSLAETDAPAARETPYRIDLQRTTILERELKKQRWLRFLQRIAYSGVMRPPIPI